MNLGSRPYPKSRERTQGTWERAGNHSPVSLHRRRRFSWSAARKSDFFSKFASPGVARISEGFCRDSAIGALRKLETGGILIVGIFWDHFFRGRGPVTSDTSGSRIRSEPASITGRDDMGHTADDPTGPTRRAVASNSLPAQPIGEGDPPEGCRRVQTSATNSRRPEAAGTGRDSRRTNSVVSL